MNFTVCLIAKNEEKTLPRLMASLLKFQERGGEVILLDTGSTDKTVETAKALGCIVEEVGDKFVTEIDEKTANEINELFVVGAEQPVVKAGDKLFDYSASRNHVATLSKTPMVAMPDCDEEYTVLNIDAIEKAIQDGAEQLEYNFVYAHDSSGAASVKFRHCKFYNRDRQKWVGVVHEVLSGEAKRICLDEDVIKLEHFQQPSENRDRYLAGLALDCFRNQQNDRNSHYFAREMFYKGRPLSAIKEFKRHILMNGWLSERGQSMVYIGDCLMQLGSAGEALDWWHRAFLLDSSRREPLIRLAEHFYKLKDHQHTVAYAMAALTIPNGLFYADQQSHYGAYPHEMLYFALWWLGDKEGSRAHFQKALAFDPSNPKYIADKQFYA